MKWIAVPLALALLTAVPARPADAALRFRSYTAGHFALEIDGKLVGWLHSVEGGGVMADVITETPGNGVAWPKKQIGMPKYEDLVIQVGMDLSPEFYDWLHSFFDGQGTRKNGTIIYADFDRKSRATHEFTNALITEVTIPALDGASKDPAYLTIKFTPEAVRYKMGDGSVIPAVPMSTQKKWSPANFRLTLGDLPCTRVGKIDAFTVKQQIVTFTDGGGGGTTKIPGRLEFPNLRFTVSRIDAQPWIDWGDAFLVKGKNSDGEEIEGSLTMLDPQGGSLARIDLHHVGLAGLTILPAVQSGDPAQPLTVDVYEEKQDFSRTP